MILANDLKKKLSNGTGLQPWELSTIIHGSDPGIFHSMGEAMKSTESGLHAPLTDSAESQDVMSDEKLFEHINFDCDETEEVPIGGEPGPSGSSHVSDASGLQPGCFEKEADVFVIPETGDSNDVSDTQREAVSENLHCSRVIEEPTRPDTEQAGEIISDIPTYDAVALGEESVSFTMSGAVPLLSETTDAHRQQRHNDCELVLGQFSSSLALQNTAVQPVDQSPVGSPLTEAEDCPSPEILQPGNTEDLSTQPPAWEAKGPFNDANIEIPPLKSEAERKLLKTIGFPSWPYRGRKHSVEFKNARSLCIRRYRVHIANKGKTSDFRGDVYFSFDEQVDTTPTAVVSKPSTRPKTPAPPPNKPMIRLGPRQKQSAEKAKAVADQPTVAEDDDDLSDVE